MRPTILHPLFADVDTLKGIGPRLKTLLTKLLDRPGEVKTPRKIDLLWHFPTGVVDRRNRPKIKDLKSGELATFDATVIKHKGPKFKGKGRFSKAPYRITMEDSTGQIDLVFFRIDPKFLDRQMPIGEIRYISGRPELYADHLQIPHPDHMLTKEEFETFPALEPVYPLTQGLTGKVLNKAMSQLIPAIPELEEWQEPEWIKKKQWPTFHQALTSLHRPEELENIKADGSTRQRLAYDEL